MSDQNSTSDQSIQPLDIIGDPDIPKFYVNGFFMGTSLSDAFVIVQRAGKPSAVLFMSLIAAKSLVNQLGSMVSDFEKITGQELLTMEDISEASGKSAKGDKE